MSYNLYQRLRGLFPGPALQVGTITAITGSLATIELPDGSKTTAIGSGTVGQQVYIRDGAIEGLAPGLSVVDITI